MDNLKNSIDYLIKKNPKIGILTTKYDEMWFVCVGSKTSNFYKKLIELLEHHNVYYYVTGTQKYEYIIEIHFE